MDKVSNEQVVEIIETEGLGYAIGEYLNADNIEDETLATMWEEAQNLLHEIDNYLGR